ncbi:MAG: CPBP family glutamic-type intramembrane protease [Planctomycetota bacterium]
MTDTNDRWPVHSPEPAGLRAKARLALARRDLLEFIRDRRTLFVTLLLPMAMYPVLALSSALGVRTALSDIDARQAPTNLGVVLSGSPWDVSAFAQRVETLSQPDEGPGSRDWPASITFGFASAEEARKTVEAGRATLWLAVPADVLDRLNGKDTLEIEAHGPESRVLAPQDREQFTAVMQSLADDARQRRIQRAGLPDSLLKPLKMLFTGKADSPGTLPTRRMLPTAAGGVFVLLAVLTMTGAFYPAIDAIAGEKERGTIETLLIAPCAAIDIVTGKFLAVWAVALAALVANAISIALTAAVTLRFLPKGGPLLPDGHLPVIIIVSLLAFIGLSAVAAAMCLAVTTASKSGKEAQNTLTPVLLFASALAGAGLLSDLQSNLFLPAVPFAGQVAISRATLQPDPPTVGMQVGAVAAGQPDWLGAVERVAWPLAASLISSAVIVWLLLKGTASLLTDEDILFRGPDVAGGLLTRPVRRRRPTVLQGLSALAIGLTGLWYSQGIAPADFSLAIPVQQAAAVVLPLVALMAWQRVDLSRTFGLRWPGALTKGVAWRTAVSLAGSAAIGAGLFVIGAAILLSIRGTLVSAEARSLAEKLVAMMREKPLWLSWTLIALVPAVCEEVLFRGWVQSALVGAWPSRGRMVAGVIAQAACFAIFHLLPERMPQTFALGLVAGLITLSTRSLLPAIVCHAAHNSVPLVLLWLAGGLSGSDTTAAATAAATGVSLPPWIVLAAVASVAAGAAAIWLAVRQPWPAGLGRLRSASLLVIWLTGFLAAASPLGAVAAAAEPAAAQANAVPQRLRVAVFPIAAAVEWKGDHPTGVAIELWTALAERIGVDYDFVRMGSFKQTIDCLTGGEADVALGLAITEEREQLIDLTHPIVHSGLRIAVRQRESATFLQAVRSLLSWDLLQVLGVVLLLALASGHLLWWFERRDNPQSFPPGSLPRSSPAAAIISTWPAASAARSHLHG